MKRIKNVILLVMISVIMTGCTRSKTLTCEYSNDEASSKFVATVRGDEVVDMQLTTDMKLTPEKKLYKAQIIQQIKQKTDKVYETEDGIKAIFDMDSEYFNNFGLSKDASYGELKQMLELEGYTCK